MIIGKSNNGTDKKYYRVSLSKKLVESMGWDVGTQLNEKFLVVDKKPGIFIYDHKK